MTPQPRIMLVEDHRLMLEGLRLELQDEFEIVAMLGTGAPVAEACARLAPDLVLLDLSLPDQSGLEVIDDVMAVARDTRILVLTMHADRVLAEAALQAGARGFVPKNVEVEELKQAMRNVLAGEVYVSPLIGNQPPHCSTVDLAFGLAQLTPRQQDILRLLGDGKSSARIAAELHVSPNTVTFHRARIRKILGIPTEWGLMRHAMIVRMSESRQRSVRTATPPTFEN